MNARLLFILYFALMSHSITVKERADNPIISETKVELKPLIISCQLNDIVTITTPVVNTKEALYYLTKPNGDTTKIDVKQHNNFKQSDFDYNEISVNHIKEDSRAIIRRLNNYEVINPNNIQVNIEEDIQSSDVNIGPLTEDDHGNWVISVFYKDINDNWIELFQVVTIRITETVPSSPSIHVLKSGKTFRPSFAYPIKGLQSCELIAPRSTFDRFYARSRVQMDRCEYVIDNVTKADEGLWKIIGVGKIVYETEMYVKVSNKVS